MTKEERQKIYAVLAAPFPEAAIERTEGRTTGRGYDTSGIKYQYIVNRLNEVLGIGGYRAERKIAVKEVTTAKGRSAYEAICEIKLELGEWTGGAFLPFAQALGDGGHTSTSEADARKGAYTNAFKKAAAFHGVGRQAYEGTLDDDNVPLEEAAHSPPRQQSRPTPADRDPIQHKPTTTPAIRLHSVGPASPSKEDTKGTAQQPEPRNRLSGNQLNALWAIARGRGQDERAFRNYVQNLYRIPPEQLTRDQASHLISTLTSNGSNQRHERQLSAAG